MNDLKNKLLYLKEQNGLVALKTDMESEIISIDEIKILKSISTELDLKFVMKIGGCGAISDILKCKEIGADIVVAPMIESEYALEKFIQTCKDVYGNQTLPKLHVNIETITGVKNFDEIVSKHLDKFSAVVFGRSDFTDSIKSINANSSEVFDYIDEVKNKTQKIGKEFIVGGSLTEDSISFVEKLQPTYVETRNLVFKPFITKETIKRYIEFEICWLNKRKTKNQLNTERLKVLQNRL